MTSIPPPTQYHSRHATFPKLDRQQSADLILSPKRMICLLQNKQIKQTIQHKIIICSSGKMLLIFSPPIHSSPRKSDLSNTFILIFLKIQSNLNNAREKGGILSLIWPKRVSAAKQAMVFSVLNRVFTGLDALTRLEFWHSVVYMCDTDIFF